MIFRHDKYEILEHGESLTIDNSILHRIRALKDFGDVKKGDIGGWISSYENLSQNDLCWIYDESCVYDSAIISGNVTIRNWSLINENAYIYGNARISNCKVYGSAAISGNVNLKYANIYENAYISGNAHATGENNDIRVNIHGNSSINENAKIFFDADISDNVKIIGTPNISGSICGDILISGNAVIERGCLISGHDAAISGCAKITGGVKLFLNGSAIFNSSRIWYDGSANEDK